MLCSQEADPSLVIFDLDGVLTRRDTMGVLVLRQLRSHPWRLCVAAPLFVVSVVASPAGKLRPRINRCLVRLGLRGLTMQQYTHLAREVGQDLASRADFPRVKAIRVARAATRAVVVTASEDQLARAYLQGVGLGHVPVIASTVAPSARGLALARHNVGAAKVEALRLHGIDPSEAILYTDSASDLPLGRQAAHVVLVDPSASSQRRFEAQIDVETVRWS